jgi:hypothetical protein
VSRGQRLGLIALAVAVAVVAFVVARPEDGDDEQPTPAADTTTREPSGTAEEPTATTDPRPETRVVLRAHRLAGGMRRIEAKKGELVRITVESDAADEIHLHGYDITRAVRPAEPARFSFRANIEGIFEVESHEAEHGGGDAVIARLVVEPS